MDNSFTATDLEITEMNTPEQKQYSEGQQLFWVPSDRRDGPGKFVTITRVGRKYLELNNHRKVYIESLKEVTQYGSGAKCFETKEEHDAIVRRESLWAELKNVVSGYRIPDDITIEKLENALQALKS